jgi:hypothetical protein
MNRETLKTWRRFLRALGRLDRDPSNRFAQHQLGLAVAQLRLVDPGFRRNPTSAALVPAAREQ